VGRQADGNEGGSSGEKMGRQEISDEDEDEAGGRDVRLRGLCRGGCECS
jgi:hypothetical protein